MSFQSALITVAAPLIHFIKDIFSDASVVVGGDIRTGPATIANVLCDGVVAEVVSLLTFSVARLSQCLTLPITKFEVSCRIFVFGIC